MKTIFLFLFSCLFVSSAYALPDCPSDVSSRWHNCVGTVTFENGNKYEGEWKDDKRHGQGTLTVANANGAKYVGEWKDDKKHGQGTFTYADGSKYVGEYRDDKYHGQGTYTYANGGKYVGEYRDDKYHGQGTETFADGSKYVGEYRDDKYHGQGTLTFANGAKYVGEWRDRKRHGQGTLTFADGDTAAGTWRDDKYIGQGEQRRAEEQRQDVVVINCTITNSWGVGGWQISLDQQGKTAHARFIGRANAWTSLTAGLLDETLELNEVETAEGSFYDFGKRVGSSFYKVFIINRGNMKFRYASSTTGSTNWGNCRHAPKGL